MSRFALTALAVLILPLLLGASIACGGDSDRDTGSDRRERTSGSGSTGHGAPDVPRDPESLIPVDSEFAVIFEVSDMLGSDAPRELQGDFEVWADELFDGDIDLYDVDTLVVIEDSLLLAQGNFDFDLIRDGLEGLGYEADDYLGFEVWGERAALVPQGDYVVIGFAPEAVRDLLQSANQGRNLAAYERNSDLAALLDEIGPGDVTVLMPSHCEDISTGGDFSTGGCYASGVTYTFLDARDDATMMRLVFLHEDSETAEDFVALMQLVLLDDRSGLGSGDARVDGNAAILDVTVSNSEIDYFFDLFQAGPVARRLGPSSSSRDAAPAATSSGRPLATSSLIPSSARSGDSIQDAGRINPGQVVSERLGRGESHFYEFNAQRGRTYTIETEADFDTYLVLVDDSEDEIEFDNSGSDFSSLIQWTARYSGTHFVAVTASAYNGEGHYNLFLTLLDPDDHGGDFDDATAIDAGGRVDGRIEEGDADYFVFDARRGDAFILETNANFDTYIELYDDRGREIAYDDDDGEGGASLLWWTAEYSGTHYLKVRGYGSSDTGSYELSLSRLDPDDHGSSMRNSTVLDVRDDADGSILEDDEDYFEVDLRRGRSYVFETQADFDTVIELLDDSGQEIGYDDDDGQDSASRLEWTAEYSGEHFVVVRGYGGSDVGTYRLLISESR